MLTSIVIPTKGRFRSLVRCLESIVNYTPERSYEILLCHDDTERAFPEALRVLCWSLGDVILLHNETGAPLGYARNLNRGLERARGDYLTIPGIANDIEVKEGWLEKATRFMYDHPSVGMGAFTVYRPNGDLESRGGFIDAPFINYEFGVEPDYCGYGIVSRSCFKKVGGMDPNYTGIYYEDADYGMMVHRAGYRILPIPGAEIIHHAEGEGRIPLAQSPNLAYFQQKWGRA